MPDELAEMDGRVLKALGWTFLSYDEEDPDEPWQGISPEGLPGCCHAGGFAEDIGAAWTLVEELRGRGLYIDLSNDAFAYCVRTLSAHTGERCFVTAGTAPEAITRAFLVVVEEVQDASL